MNLNPPILDLAGRLIIHACRRLPQPDRGDREREWTAELPAILNDPDVRPAAPRAARTLIFAVDHRRTVRSLPGVGRRYVGIASFVVFGAALVYAGADL